MIKTRLIAALFVFCSGVSAQVYSPKLLRDGQPDSTDLKKFAAAIYVDAGAHTQREKAEAIWRFFLTDGRFVKPGFWYHIAGWTYEEPSGEVLDPIKLLNSYGFGLCYHIAPLLAAVFDAGGFESARCWFLTGHTVTEVFYDGAYHYFDSDMMGYNVAGTGAFEGKPVVSVRSLEHDPTIIMGKLVKPNSVTPGVVDNPWYPADVRASAMGDLAGLFTSTADNYLYPFTRYTPNHSMDFVLRPGEKLIRFFEPEEPGLFYLPYKFDGNTWTEFPKEFSEYQIHTPDGPRSQKDNRLWATGRIEYMPASLPDADTTIIDMPSPYVIIDARFSMTAELPAQASLQVETSTDGGHTWLLADKLSGPHTGAWSTEPKTLATSAHGRMTAVSGSYGYKVRLTKSGARIEGLRLVSRIQLNPRSLPEVKSGGNRFTFSSALPVEEMVLPFPAAKSSTNIDVVNESGQTYFRPATGKTGESIYELQLDDKSLLSVEVGARFFDIAGGLVPDKLTAETRHTQSPDSQGTASISWSTSPQEPFKEIWTFPNDIQWRDGDPIDRLLRWPEVLKEISGLPANTKRVYVKFSSAGPAFDSIRLGVRTAGLKPAGGLTITQMWREKSQPKQHVEKVDAAATEHGFEIKAGPDVQNSAIIFSNQ